MKTILVTDEMPKYCSECVELFVPLPKNVPPRCIPLHRGAVEKTWKEERPSWCPLKQLPKAITEYEVKVSFDYDADYAQGLNACIDEILGESENEYRE